MNRQRERALRWVETQEWWKPDVWFKPKALFQKGQPFGTLASSNPAPVLEPLRRLGKLRTKVALEVGPGHAPLIRGLPFKRRFYLDVSEQILRGLRERARDRAVAGSVEQLPFAPHARFDVVVLNEVLTHVRPGRRLGVVRELARRTAEHLVITDRIDTGVFAEKGRRSIRKTGRAEARFLVDDKPLLAHLRRAGFSVSTSYHTIPDFPNEYSDYFVIHARRLGSRR